VAERRRLLIMDIVYPNWFYEKQRILVEIGSFFCELPILCYNGREHSQGGIMQQLRIYTIHRGKIDEFAGLWRQGIAPLREKVGFQVQGAWVIRETNQFVWLIGYDGPEEWAVIDQAYFDSPERKKMDPDPAQYIARVEQYFVEPVEKL
jgi:hypothetical protein